jgi:hypothetical protein
VEVVVIDATLRLDYDDQWVEVDLGADPASWAREVVEQRWADEGLAADPAGIEVMVAAVSQVVSGLSELNAGMAFLLYPAADGPLVTVVTVRAFDMEPDLSPDGLAAELSFPEQMLEQPIDRSTVDTASGPALRLVQRYREPVSPGVEQVREHIVFAWLFTPEETVVTLSTTFVDLAVAQIWQPAVDELAQSLVLQQ